MEEDLEREAETIKGKVMIREKDTREEYRIEGAREEENLEVKEDLKNIKNRNNASNMTI